MTFSRCLVLQNEMEKGHEKYGPMLSIDDGWSRTQREIEELREAVHNYGSILRRPESRVEYDKNDLRRIGDEALQVAAMAMRLRELAIAYIDKLDDIE